MNAKKLMNFIKSDRRINKRYSWGFLKTDLSFTYYVCVENESYWEVLCLEKEEKTKKKMNKVGVLEVAEEFDGVRYWLYELSLEKEKEVRDRLMTLNRDNSFKERGRAHNTQELERVLSRVL